MDFLTVVIVLGCIITVVGIFMLVMRDKGITGRVDIEGLDESKPDTRDGKNNTDRS